MKRVNWKKLVKCIPFSVQVHHNEFWEVVWVDDFPDGETIGECRYDQKQIAIKKNMSNKLSVITYLHECGHLFSDKTMANLTEAQILALENSFYYILKPNNIFNFDK